MRLWAEQDQTPEISLALASIRAISRISIAFVWLWHGLVPKLLFRHVDEQTMLHDAGIPVNLLPRIGVTEIVFALAMLCTWNVRWVFLVNIFLMLAALVGVAAGSAKYLVAAFNPVTLNEALIALSLVGYLAAHQLPSARHCLRAPAKEPR